MGQKVAGTCYFKIDGEQIDLTGSVEVPLSDTTRETVMSHSGPAGFKETARAPHVKISAIFVKEFPLETLRNGTDITCTVELANGRVYTLAGAYLVGETNIAGDEGTTELTFEGNQGIWTI